jgi:ubiquinone/menaquinone biosynthesis C-methylase UbiE
VDLAEYRKSSHDIWEKMAAGWDCRTQWTWDATRHVSEWMVAKLDPQPGQTILELAAGTGETGFAAATRMGEEGRLITTDFASAMLEAAERHARDLGISHTEFRVMDAEQMDLSDNSVDGVLCRFGYMLMGDSERALRETHRVLRDGGRVSMSVWGSLEQNPWAAVAGAVLVAKGHMPMPQPGDPGIFSLGTEERLREVLGAAGFGSIETEAIPVEWRFDDFDDYWTFLRELAGVVAVVLEKLPDDERAEVRDLIEQNAASFRADGGAYVMPGVALSALAS